MSSHEPLLAGIAAIVAVLVVAWVLYLKYFVVVPPNQAIVVFGRSRATAAEPGGPPRPNGARIEVGGGVFVPPWTKDYTFLPLGVIDVGLALGGVATADSEHPRVNVRLSTEVKIPADPEGLRTAAENLLGKNEEQLASIARGILEGYVRGEFAKRTLPEIEIEREKVAAEVHVLAATDLVAIGMIVKSVSIREIVEFASPDRPPPSETRTVELEGLVWQMSSRVRKLEARLDALEHGAVLVGQELHDLHA